MMTMNATASQTRVRSGPMYEWRMKMMMILMMTERMTELRMTTETVWKLMKSESEPYPGPGCCGLVWQHPCGWPILESNGPGRAAQRGQTPKARGGSATG